MAARTCDTRPVKRASGLASAGATIVCQPASFAHVCHCAASAASRTAIAGGWPAAMAHAKRLMAHARANPPGNFLDLLGLLDGAERENKALVFLDLQLQLLRQFHELRGVFDVLFVFGPQDL